jgi:hypothetical protein
VANSITCNGLTLRVGDKCVITERGRRNCKKSLNPSDILTIGKIVLSDEKEMSNIGVISTREIGGFHDLDGMTSNGHGYYFRMTNFLKGHFELLGREMIVASNWNFRGRNFKGMKCKFITNVVSGLSYVEFDEDVGGGAADGLGKAGRCVMVPQGILKSAEKAKSKKKG